MRMSRIPTEITIAALAAPAAQARPADPAQRDMHASVAIAASQQSQARPLPWTAPAMSTGGRFAGHQPACRSPRRPSSPTTTA